MADTFNVLFRYLPIVLVLAGVAQLILGMGELHLTGRTMSMMDLSMPGERWLLLTGYVRAAVDGLWTIGFAGVVAAASRYIDGVAAR